MHVWAAVLSWELVLLITIAAWLGKDWLQFAVAQSMETPPPTLPPTIPLSLASPVLFQQPADSLQTFRLDLAASVDPARLSSLHFLLVPCPSSEDADVSPAPLPLLHSFLLRWKWIESERVDYNATPTVTTAAAPPSTKEELPPMRLLSHADRYLNFSVQLPTAFGDVVEFQVETRTEQVEYQLVVSGDQAYVWIQEEPLTSVRGTDPTSVALDLHETVVSGEEHGNRDSTSTSQWIRHLLWNADSDTVEHPERQKTRLLCAALQHQEKSSPSHRSILTKRQHIPTSMSVHDAGGGARIRIPNLEPATKYAVASVKRNAEGEGMVIHAPVLFETAQATSSCLLPTTNFTFCSKVQYAVYTGENSGMTVEELDQRAQRLYDEFVFRLYQYNCYQPITHMYSPVRTCVDCTNAYKNWICSQLLPKCSGIGGGIVGIGESGAIVKPCDYYCHQVVQSCPSFLQFECPPGDTIQWSYTSPPDQDCNILGI